MATFIEMMNRLNQFLELYGQRVRVTEYRRTSLVLSTGCVLFGKDVASFKRRVFSKHTTIWVENMDRLLGCEVSDKEIRHLLAVQRGKAAWAKNSDKIRMNLNTGIPWIKGKKGLFVGRKHTELSKRKIGEKNAGEKNGMFGKSQSVESRKKKSVRMKEKILAGEFTPNSTNRYNRWHTEFDGKKYRSSWEALYASYNSTAEYETLRLAYEFNGQEKIYIVDFVDHNNRLVVEIKPRNMWTAPDTLAKIKSLNTWAVTNSYQVCLIDQQWLVNNIPYPDTSRFDSKTAKKIKDLYETCKKN